MPHPDDMDLDDIDKRLVADSDYNRQHYAANGDDDAENCLLRAVPGLPQAIPGDASAARHADNVPALR